MPNVPRVFTLRLLLRLFAMGLAFQSTPNPHAIKCVPSMPLLAMAQVPGTNGPRSYAAIPEGDKFAVALFGVGGVTNVLITPSWFTVSKTADTQWSTVKAGVQTVFDAWQRSEAASNTLASNQAAHGDVNGARRG